MEQKNPTVSNYLGRLTTEGTYAGTNWVNASEYGYGKMGRTTLNAQAFAAQYNLNYTYDYLGNPATSTNMPSNHCRLLELASRMFHLRQNPANFLRELDGLLGTEYNQSQEQKRANEGNHAVLFAPSGFAFSAAFSSPLIADLNPRIPSPSPLPSSGSFLGPKMSSAIPAMMSKCIG
jgi:hypothetical protein